MRSSFVHRVGAVSFLNTVPLICGLDEREDVQVLRDLPSKLADRLYEDQIDVGMIPVVEYLRGVGGDIVPGICIGSRGPVHSVKVFSKIPLDKAESVAVDRGSRSSVALLRILLAELYDRHPDLHTVSPQAEDPFREHDTALIIGDRAMQVDASQLYEYDLGAMWYELTNLPFVFAVWVLSPAYSRDEAKERRVHLLEILSEAKREGFAQLPRLANEHTKSSGHAPETLIDYWSNSICYDLAEDELAGLQRFAQLARRHNLCAGREAVHLAMA
jgi:chorismate dehydratase